MNVVTPSSPSASDVRYRVDIEGGDAASRIAYAQPLVLDGGFSGLVDVGPFLLASNSDGIGSKVLVAQALDKHDTLGYDLVAMVADDCVCVGAEPLFLTDTLDVERVNQKVATYLMSGLHDACLAAGVALVGGEIAELPDQVKGYTWNAALVGIVSRDRVLGRDRVLRGDALVGLLVSNFRSNGFTLVRSILEKELGPGWPQVPYNEKKTWGEEVLTPSDIFAPFVLDMVGRFQAPPEVAVHGIAHITGGGLSANVSRVLPEGLSPVFTNLPPPPRMMEDVKKMGGISDEEAYKVWNMGIGMVVITPSPCGVLKMAEERDIPAQVIGEVR
ncbi:MAG: phosphoribosylformylglycinamidine cyclo-ligase [Armatimonadetes bacterium]|nr:phosphoribosylformylglycinamidine cyclo-ligase [Armatimonadota bacterium]